MAEYIEREAAYQTLTEYYHHTTEGMHSALREAISRVPAADVRPVVTCADCKHWARIKKDCILASCDLDALVRCEDFYCANVEKREKS